MLKGSEKSSVWAGLKREFDSLRWQAQRIESKVELGIPDVNVHVPKFGDIWLELKFVRSLGRTEQEPIELGLRREQYNWMWENHRAGRKVLLVAKVGTAWYIWKQPKAWELAKSPTPWVELLRLAHKCRDAATVCASLQGQVS